MAVVGVVAMRLVALAAPAAGPTPRLEAGPTVADIGCGCGRSALLMVEAPPRRNICRRPGQDWLHEL